MRAQHLPLPWLVQQSLAAVENNDVILPLCLHTNDHIAHTPIIHFSFGLIYLSIQNKWGQIPTVTKYSTGPVIKKSFEPEHAKLYIFVLARLTPDTKFLCFDIQSIMCGSGSKMPGQWRLIGNHTFRGPIISQD